MNIAIMIGSMNRGGTERVIANLSNYLVRCGDTVSIVSLHVEKDEYELNPAVGRYVWDLTEEETKGGVIGRISNYKARKNKLGNIIRKINPDLVLSFIGKNNIMALLTAGRMGIPVAVAVRGEPTEEYYNTWMRILSKTLFAKAQSVILQTGGQLAYFPKKIRNKAVILKNPLNEKFMTQPVPLDERDPLIVAVGRIDANKNHKMIIDAFSNISDEFPEYRLKIFGEGELKETLTEYVKTLGKADKIELPGRITDVADAIKKARVFVLTSNTEGSPNTLIEAMCLSICCISTDCPSGGPGELITPGENGLLIPVGDTAKMQDVLQNLLNNLHEINRISQKALATRDIFKPEIVLEQWRDVLQSIIKQGKANSN